MVGQWLRAARDDRDRRATALRFAAGITIAEAGWVARLALPHSWALPSFLVLVACELAVPLVAESAGRTTWHAEHIAERYGLFTLIVLGESVLAASNAVGSALDSGAGLGRLLGVAGAGTVTVFAMWWLYFDQPVSDLPLARGIAFFWGYGHYLVFASAAAVGAGLSVAADGSHSAGYAVAVPVAGYVVAVWVVQILPYRRKGLLFVVYPVAAALVLLAPLLPGALPVIAALLAVLAGLTAWCRIDAAAAREAG
jgi:low temperature requirement protein LtrA